jgi:hypothetical protein
MEASLDKEQGKPEPSEVAEESVLIVWGMAFRRRHPDAVFKPPFAALRGNPGVVSEKEKREQDFCRCSMKSVMFKIPPKAGRMNP